MDQTELRGKKLALLFFDPSIVQDNRWTFLECNATVKETSSYSNLCNHINAKHRDWIQSILKRKLDAPKKLFQSLTYPRKTTSIHAWIQCVALCLQRFSFCENVVIRRHFKHESICRNALLLYMRRLMESVESKIMDMLPERFAIVFDGWSGGGTHYVGFFATYPAENELGFRKHLLGLSPMGDEDSLDASEHYDYVEYVLGVHGKKFNNVVAIICDNTSTNKAFVRRVGSFFLGCHSHRFNLAMTDILSGYSDAIDKVHELMKRLRYQIPAAKLRRLTHLTALTANKTRWSSTYMMVKRYFYIKEHIKAIYIPDVKELLLDDDEELVITTFMKKLHDLESVTKQLQSDSVTVAEYRGLLDALIELHPSTRERLKQNSEIVADPLFESAVIKVQSRKESSLCPAEKMAIRHLLNESSSSVENEKKTHLSFAERVLKIIRTEIQTTQSKYIDLRFILATSNIFERLFSAAGFALTDHRQRLLPANFECQMYLHVNIDLWDISDVHELMQ